MATTVLLGACGESTPRLGGAARRDSAGVEIVENRAPAEQSSIVVDAEPSVVVGESELSLGRVVAAFALSDGRLVIADAAEVAVYVIADDGRVQRRFGRRGQGPGEFGTITNVWPYRGDSVVVYVGGMQRYLTVMSLQGAAGRSWRAAGADSSHYFLIPLGTTADGRFIVRTMNVITPAEPERIETPSTELLAFSHDWESVSRLGRFPDNARFRGRGMKLGALLFSEATRFAWFEHRVVAAPTVRAEYLELRANATLRRSVRWPGEPQPVSAAEAAHERDRRVRETRERLRGAPAAIMDRAIDGALLPLLRALPRPEVLPVVGALLPGEAGQVWVLGYTKPGENTPAPNVAQVFDSTGRWRATVRLPSRLRVVDITSDALIGIWRDDLGGESVRVYRYRAAAS